MAAERASKRRKVDSDAAPLAVQTEAPLAHSGEANGTGHTVTGQSQLSKTQASRKRTRRSSVVDAPATQTQEVNITATTNGSQQEAQDANGEHTEEADPTIATPARGRPKSGAAVNKGSARKSPTKAAPAVQDVEMEDAVSVTATSQADSMDTDAPRSSGRKRQVSKKLEDAQTTGPGVSPSVGRGKRTPAKRTPAKRTPAKQAQVVVSTEQADIPAFVVLEETPSKPPPRRRGRPPATPKRAPDAEIPDSEPEDGTTKEVVQDVAVITQPAAESLVVPTVPPDERPSGMVNEAETALVTPKKKTKVPSKPPPYVPPAPESLTPQAKQAYIHEDSPDLDIMDGITVTNDPVMASDTIVDEVEFKTQELAEIQSTLMQRITRRALTKLVGLDAEVRKVSSLVTQTVTAGESNSMVIIGARGSGKTAMVDSILAQQQVDHSEDFHVVRLSGFIHTDDRVAIREIWRQLGREMDIEEDSSVKNYADTMTTLLALLSHPSETGQDEDGRIAKSVIIILDEFDLFTTHPRQTLLYNLFDIAQSRKAPLLVLGLTTRYDVAEALEKRVKSRFSHRQVYIPLARTFASYKEMARSCLTLPSSAPWNTVISHLFDSSQILNTHLQQHYHTTKSIPALQTSLLLPISTLPSGPQTGLDTITHLETALSLCPPLSPPDSNLTLLPSLSSLELAILICAARLLIIHDTDSATFPLAYDEYKALASKARIAASAAGALATARVWGQGVARLAWEGLVDKGLVVPVGERSRGGQGPCRIDVGLEEIGQAVDAGLEAGNVGRWCKEI